MRKTVLLLLLALLVPAAAQSQSTTPQNGTLVDSRGSRHRPAGRARQHDRPRERQDRDHRPEAVRQQAPGRVRRDEDDLPNVKTTVYQGKNLRFRLIGARFQFRIQGQEIFLSAIARGEGVVDGAGDPTTNVFYDGTWSLNDSPPLSLPDTATPFERRHHRARNSCRSGILKGRCR